MGQAVSVSSAPEGDAVAIGREKPVDETDSENDDSTDSGSKDCGDDSSFDSSSSSSSSSSQSTKTTSLASASDQLDREETTTESIAGKSSGESRASVETAAKRKAKFDALKMTERKSNLQPPRVLLPKPSTPAQWKATFSACTDDELVSLLVQDCGNDGGGNDDLSPLGVELRRKAAQIKEHRALEMLFGSGGEASGPNRKNAMCFYKVKRQKDRSTDKKKDEDGDDDELIELCMRILNASLLSSQTKEATSRSSWSHAKGKPLKPILTLPKLRQKLVPSKLKEHVFWESLWVLLYERKKLRDKQACFKRVEASANEASVVLEERGRATKTPNERIALLEEHLKTTWDCISDLTVRIQSEASERQKMENLVERLWEKIPREEEELAPLSATRKGRHPPPKAPDCEASRLPCVKSAKSADDGSTKSSPEDVQPPMNDETDKRNQQQQHTGTWELSKDSVEFLAFPSEAKEALRTEKQKRLKRVNEEMAFILDSDDLSRAPGKWSCCQATRYNDGCGCVPATG